MRVEPTWTMRNTPTTSLLRPPYVAYWRIDSYEEIIVRNRSWKTLQPSAKEISIRMAEPVLRSIMQRRFRESSQQDFAVISELAEVCDDDCKYQILLVRLRRKLRVLSGESSPRYYLNSSINTKTFPSEDSVPLNHQPEEPRPRDPNRPLVLIFSQ
jgi:hypothetical protein